MPAPLLGYNTNVHHRGKTYHVQTEDSGLEHPHVVTHMFADGGRIVATRKESYTEILTAEDREEQVRRRMQKQHGAMCMALEQGRFDERLDGVIEASAPPGKRRSMQPARRTSTRSTSLESVSLDDAVLKALREEFGSQS